MPRVLGNRARSGLTSGRQGYTHSVDRGFHVSRVNLWPTEAIPPGEGNGTEFPMLTVFFCETVETIKAEKLAPGSPERRQFITGSILPDDLPEDQRERELTRKLGLSFRRRGTEPVSCKPVRGPKPHNAATKKAKRCRKIAAHLAVRYRVTLEERDYVVSPLPAVRWWPDLEFVNSTGVPQTPRGINTDSWKLAWRRLLWLHDPRCLYCGENTGALDCTLDHIHPRSRGGEEHVFNLGLSCGGCNRLKADHTPEELFELFNLGAF